MKRLYIFLLILMVLNTISDKSYADSIQITVSPINIKFYIEDPQGRKTGRTPNGFMQQIPYADQYGTRSETNEPNPGPYQQWNIIYTSDSNAVILPGKYKVGINSSNITTETKVEIGVEMTWSNSNVVQTARVLPVEYIFPGLTYVFEFDIPATPPANHQLTFIKVSNPKDLIADINALEIAKHIGDQHLVSELIKKINDIEAEKAKGKIDDGMTSAQKAKKEYQELLKEVNEKNTKPEKDEFVDELALYILERDVDYIINHIQ